MTLERALEKLAEANTLNAELLEVLESLVRRIEEFDCEFYMPEDCRTARAAIAKARGET